MPINQRSKHLKGVAQLAEQVLTMTTEADVEEKTLAESVRTSLKKYFSQLEGQTPANLYNLVLAEVEKPLLELVLKLTNNNQSKAAIILGLSRGTLRKKMAAYALNHK
ncbi:MAG: DNA-binding transcriptional regulator Fis [Coxiellaceae bacterium]|nr:DNA-binding transcriptional regulator Fis [Coxiellaceae bacterium]|tara:strand:+ start:6835 stop:7158 length:324 start_codon:yes stop_codon:yes gene_type:complete